MIGTKTFFESKDKGVNLEVRTRLLTIDEIACEQVWKVVEMAGIKEGSLVLFVNKKVTGQSTMTNAVKIVGPANENYLKLKFQTSAASCFEGALTLRVNGGGMEYASRLETKLRTVTGIGWFDPARPEVKKLIQPAPAPMPIAPVAPVLVAAAEVTLEKAGNGPKASVKGLVKNFAACQSIFSTVAAKLEGGLIGKHDVSIIVMSHVGGKPAESGFGAGPVLAAWVRLGYVASVEYEGKKCYTLTAATKTMYDLPPFEPYKGTIESAPASVPRTKKSGRRMGKPSKAKILPPDEMIGIVTKATESYQKLQGIRAEIEKLNAEMAELDKKKAKIAQRLKKLNKQAHKPSLLKSESLLQAFVKK